MDPDSGVTRYITLATRETEVQPELAAVLLAASPWVVSDWDKVRRLARDMAGEWRPGDSQVIVSTEGRVLDGVHRLTAGLLRNRPFGTQVRLVREA